MRRNVDFFKKFTPLKCEQLKSTSQLLDYIEDKSVIGLEMDVLPYNNVRFFENFFNKKNSKIIDASNFIKDVRMVKSDIEINFIRKAGMIIKKVFMELIDYIEPGKTEYDIFCYAIETGIKNFHQGFMRMRGFNQEMYFGHILSGENGLNFGYTNAPTCGTGIYPSFPQGSSLRKVKSGEILSVDLVGCYNGYHCDQTRPFAVDRIDKKVEDKFKIVKEIFYEIFDFIKPGVSWEECYFKGIEIAKKLNVLENFMGFKDDKVNFFGHGIGVEIDEPPFLAPKFNQQIIEGMTIAIEPKLFFPEIGVIGLENTVVVTGSGCEKLTPCEDKIF